LYVTNNNINLDTTALTCGSCPSTKTRNPDSLSVAAFCDYDCTANNIDVAGSKCPNASPNISLANYQLPTSFNCSTGYTFVFYKCILTTDIPKGKILSLN